jgi:hypothetical protein
MAIGDKADLQLQITNELPDNTTGAITPSNIRIVESATVTHTVNMEELTEQVIQGVIKHMSNVKFDPAMAKPVHAEGALFYDSESKSLSYYNEEDEVTVNIGQETLIRVYNNNGSTILNGQAARFDASVGGEITVVRSLADSVLSSAASGIATHDIPVGQTGYITRTGKIGGIDTSSWSSGDILYVSDVNPGELTNVAPAIANPIAVVIDVDVADGSIFTGTSRLKDPVAIGQSGQGAPSSIDLTTTPIPMEGYDSVVIAENVVVSTPVGSQGDLRCQMAPTANPFSGFYDLAFQLSGFSSGNVVVVMEVYRNGSPTGLLSKYDFTNNSIDEGSIVIPRAFTETSVTPSDVLEVYAYTVSGTTTFTVDSLMFNTKRAGLI